MKRTSSFFGIAVLASLVLTAPGVSSTWAESQKLVVPDASIQDYFGYSVAIDRGTLVIGARWEDDRGVDAGAAYVFERDTDGTGGWKLVKKLTASDGSAVDNFGWSVAIDGDTVVVGAVFNAHTENENGSAYVFERHHGGTDQWGQVKKLIALDAQSKDHFGDAVAVAGHTIVIGAPLADDVCLPPDLTCDSGTVYLFERDLGGARNWGQSAKLTASDGALRDHFGDAVSIADHTIVIAAPWDDDRGEQSGSAYVFTREDEDSPWFETVKLTASDGTLSDDFGSAVAVSGSMIVVGARLDDGCGVDGGGCNSGSAYVFEREDDATWTEVAKLIASDEGQDDRFGTSVSISGPTVVVGAHRNADEGSLTGSAYVFSRDLGGSNAWGQAAKLLASDASAGDEFGFAVAVSGETLVVGARSSDEGFIDTGSANVFNLGAPCFLDNFEDGGTLDWTLDGVGHANQASVEVVDDDGNLELALTSDGATAYLGRDNVGFLHRSVAGDFRLEASLDSKTMVTGKRWRKAGLMVRASLDHLDIRLLAMLAPVQQRLQFVAREVYGGPGNVKVATEVASAPPALRLAIERTGQTLEVQYSLDGGVTWITPTTGLGGSIEITDLPETLLIGLAMVSNNISVTSTALFDDVTLCPGS